MKILHVGDIVGSPGRMAFARVVPPLREKGAVDFVIANAENAAGGRGLTPKLAEEILHTGADVITMGDHVWDQRELIPFLDQEPRVLRPANIGIDCPGNGFISVDTQEGTVTILQVIGRVFMNPASCPFRAADDILKKVKHRQGIVMAEIHAEATSEKIAFGRHLEGRATSVVGTHTHVQTADDRLLPKGTAYLSDLGMTGPINSVLGRAITPVLSKFRTGMPAKFDVARGHIALQGAVIEVDMKSRKATSIKRINEDAGTA